ncbi:hypothetical protein D3C80_1498520 [compost metagenome]
MEQVNLDSLHIHGGYSRYGFQHHFMGFLGKPVDDMGADADAVGTQLGDSVNIALGIMRTVNQI